MTKRKPDSEVWPIAAAGVIIDMKEVPPPVGSEDVSCERKKKEDNFSCAEDFYRETYDDNYILRPSASP
jgi:hypothetical protein